MSFEVLLGNLVAILWQIKMSVASLIPRKMFFFSFAFFFSFYNYYNLWLSSSINM